MTTRVTTSTRVHPERNDLLVRQAGNEGITPIKPSPTISFSRAYRTSKMKGSLGAFVTSSFSEEPGAVRTQVGQLAASLQIVFSWKSPRDETEGFPMFPLKTSLQREAKTSRKERGDDALSRQALAQPQ